MHSPRLPEDVKTTGIVSADRMVEARDEMQAQAEMQRIDALMKEYDEDSDDDAMNEGYQCVRSKEVRCTEVRC